MKRKCVIGLMTAAVLLVALGACDLGDVLSTRSGSIKEGKVTTVATTSGSSDVRGVAVDPSGNVYVADHHNHQILKIPAGGGASSVFISETYNGGTHDLDYPTQLCWGLNGNLYVSEPYNDRITWFNANGIRVDQKTISGSGGNGMAADSSGNVYVLNGHRILKMDSGGTVTTFAGSTQSGRDSGIGNGADAKFNDPRGIAIDNQGNLYVSDTYNHCIRKITPAADVSVYASYMGSWGFKDGDSGSAMFGVLTVLTINLATGDLYTWDASSGGVRKITPGREVLPPDPPNSNPLVPEAKTPIVVGRSVYTIAGDRKWDSKERGLINGPAFSARFGWVDSDGSLGSPAALAADIFGNVYVADDANKAVRKIAQ